MPTLSGLARLGHQVSLQYRDRALSALRGGRRTAPWMKRREIALIQEILFNTRPRRCLEWGAGYSTAFFPRFVPADATWLSIEHDAAWAGELGRRHLPSQAEIRLVQPERAGWIDADQDGTYADFSTYVDWPASRAPFDFILIDGRARMACLAKAMSMLSDGGIVVLHDANRAIYDATDSGFTSCILLRDYRPDVGGLWIGRRGQSLESAFDLPRHVDVWNAAAAVGTTPIGRLLRV